MSLTIHFRPAALLAGLVCAALAGHAVAEPRLPTSRDEIRLSYAPLVRKAAPAVVNIYTRRVIKARRSPFFKDPFFRQFFGGDLGVPRDRVENSLGSGVIVRPEGIIVTNFHVIDKADEITVVLQDRRELAAEIVLTDKRTDLAVLRVRTDDGPLPFLTLRESDDIEVGDLVLAIGNP
ncbi:MAG: trypsin-like peptidase domain-containing protein, partial [Alphaproteobacteria bacterium]